MLDKDYRKEQQLRSKEELDFSEHPKPWHVLWNEAMRERQNPHTKNTFLVYNGLKASELGWTDILYSTIEDGIFIQTCQVRNIAYIWAGTPWGMAPWTTNDLTECGANYYHPRYGWYFKKGKDADSLGCIYFTSKDGAFRYTKDHLMRPDSRFYRLIFVARAVLTQQWLGTPDTKYRPIYR